MVEPSRPAFKQLRQLVLCLSLTVPKGTSTDSISQFSASLRDSIPAGEDAWEVIDKTLNNLLGYGKSTKQIAAQIRRGPLGADGLIRWLEACLEDLHIDEGLLQPKFDRLLDALKTL